MRCCMVEVCEPENKGSIGAWFVAEAARRAGHVVDILPDTKDGYDVELVSVHHCSDFPRLAKLNKRAPVRILGGHPMQNNPRPCIPFADVICIGEGESWIVEALSILSSGASIDELAKLSGAIVCRQWKNGAPIPAMRVESPLPDNHPYLNYAGTRSAAWYIEIARGCPFKCAYCELGNSSPYRAYSKERIIRAIDLCDMSKTRKINFFAPDEASHPDYNLLRVCASEKGYLSSFGSMRVDSVLKHKIQTSPNALVRVGVDGLTESTRFRVGKRIPDRMIVEYFSYMLSQGHVNFKMFMIFGYPWEKLEDFSEFERLMGAVLSLSTKKNCALRIKWTPFIPQPCTPLSDSKPIYNPLMAERILRWHAIHRSPNRIPGFHVENDGLMSARSHSQQCELTKGDEKCLLQFQ